MAAHDLDYPYEASDEASENELLDRSLSVWRGWSSLHGQEDFVPIPLDLYTGSSIGQYDCVRTIIQRGDKDLNRKNKGGWTALMYACYIGHDNVVNLLLDAGVSVHVKNNKGQTPLMLAASCGNESVAYFLLQQGAELEARDNKGWTALFHATYSGHQNMVKFLLDNNTDMEAVEPSGEFTPFMAAAIEGHEIIVQYFLQHGVNVNAKAGSGDTARSLALMKGHMKIVSLIDNYSCGPTSQLRTDPGLHFEGDLSSSDELIQRPRRPCPRGSNARKGPSIRDGPEAFARLIDKSKQDPHPVPDPQPPYPNSFVPQGYVTFVNDGSYPVDTSQIRFRDVTSPINPEDHRLDSSGGKDSNEYDIDDDGNAFSKTGALTIVSSSSSSGGLVAALGISRENSLDSNEDPVEDNHKEHTGQVTEDAEVESCSRLTDVQDDCDDKDLEQNFGPLHSKCISNEKEPKKFKDHSKPPKSKSSTEGDPGGGHKSRGHRVKYSDNEGHTNLGQCHDHKDHLSRDSDAVHAHRDDVTEAKPKDLATFLDQLGLTKYLPVLEEQDVDLQVFLSLTDNDLKEVGIKLFGPRRKMTNAIARWHSNCGAASSRLEQAYADRLEAEMQELAIQLHKACEQVEQLKAQVLQERELRSVTESCLMEDRAAWQQVHRLAADTRKCSVEMKELMHNIRCCQEELCRRLASLPEPRPMSIGQEPYRCTSWSDQTQLASNLQHSLTLGERTRELPSEVLKQPTQQLLMKTQKWCKELARDVAIVTINADRLLGREVEYDNHADGFS